MNNKTSPPATLIPALRAREAPARDTSMIPVLTAASRTKASRSSHVPSVEPLSTMISSHGTVALIELAALRQFASFEARFRVVTISDTQGFESRIWLLPSRNQA